MLTHSDSVHIRYALLLNGLVALVPATIVKGRANDPLRQAQWWTYDQHSAVIVVFAAAILGTVLVYVLVRRNLRRWWAFALSAAFTGVLPGLFYLIAAPLDNYGIATVSAMMVVGAIWGFLMGLVIYAFVGRVATKPDHPN